MEKSLKLIYEKKGFTLVELIMVIMIISVITVAAVPGFTRSLRVARFEKAVGEVVNSGTGKDYSVVFRIG